MAEQDQASTTTMSWQPNTKLENLKLIASWKTAFVYLLNPILASLWVYLQLWIYMHYTQYFPINHKTIFYLHFIAANGYACFAMVKAILTAEAIEDRLRQAGYEQRPSRPAQLDLGLNIVILVAINVQLIWRTDFDNASSAFMMYFYPPALLLAFWSLICLGSLGATIWFTGRVHRQHQM